MHRPKPQLTRTSSAQPLAAATVAGLLLNIWHLAFPFFTMPLLGACTRAHALRVIMAVDQYTSCTNDLTSMGVRTSH